MIIQDVLKREQYETTIVKLARFIYDTVRLEDRVYSLDGDGTIGVLLTCDRAGARLVEGRIRSKIENEKAFADIAEKPIRMDIQLGCLEYKREYNRDAEDRSIKVFSKNLEQLLMQAPIEDKVVLGWDPAFRTGCKLAVVDGTGKVLDLLVLMAQNLMVTK